MKDAIGDRFKNYYENRTRYFIPRRTYSIIRVDGKAFHTYTKGFERPFDWGFISDMNETALYMCKNIQGAKLAYVQSDEISILMTDFDNLATDAWFDGNIQKICSVSSSLATSKFNQLGSFRIIGESIVNFDIANFLHIPMAQFDSRVFSIPSQSEAMNYFVWRQKDCVRNSITSVAQSLYSHKELHNKNTNQMQEMIFQKGINWNDYDSREKRGGVIAKEENDKGFGEWGVIECPIFTQEPEFLKRYIPKNE